MSIISVITTPRKTFNHRDIVFYKFTEESFPYFTSKLI